MYNYCYTGNLDPSEKHRQLVTQSVWDILLQYFPDAVTMTEDKKSCHLCLVRLCYYRDSCVLILVTFCYTVTC